MGTHDTPALDSPTQGRHSAQPEPGGPEMDGALAVPLMQLRAPWHVRHARVLLIAVGVLVAATLAYGAFYVRQLASDPLSNLTRHRPAAAQGTIEMPSIPAAPAAAPPPPAAAPGAATEKAKASSSSSTAARTTAAAPRKPTSGRSPVSAPTLPAAPSAPAHRPVTHTQPAEPAPIPAGQSITAGAAGCPEAVAALGLCTPATRGEPK